ncbi:hypothetical protein DSM112329_04728 [Paraconexibacter sp. AEG42_29]|uniref:PASTA domain-containing protein n=1 Tax=Paraconexibacter sp. AEG42_29 TaxID=2997339 RepID=A0AAU7B2K3_9ACTN
MATSVPPPSGPEAGGGGGFRGLVRRRPVAWLVGTAIVALIVGAAAGQADTAPRADLDEAKQANVRLTSANATLKQDVEDARARNATLEEARDKATREADNALAEARRITARGTVPSLVSGDVDEARDNSVVGDFEWKIRQQSRISGATPGTVIAQRPRPGATLARGAGITVVVAKKAPPKPKQWVTIYSLSGGGSRRTGEFRIPEGEKVRVRYSYGGDTNDTLQLKSPDEGDDSFGDLIVNEIGPYSGVSRLYGKSGTYYLDVMGGSWDIAVQVFKRP